MANTFRMPLIVAVAIVSIAVPTAVTATTKASSMPARTTGTDNGAQTAIYSSYAHNMAQGAAQYDNRWLPLGEQGTSMLHRYALNYDAAAGERRSYSSDSSGFSGHGQGGLGAVLNGLTNLSGMGHITNGYGSVAPTHTEALAVASSKQEIPIYEEQHEDAAVAAVAATAHDYGDIGAGQSGYGGGEHIQQHSTAGFNSAIYNYPAAIGEHADGFLPSFGGGEQGSWAPSSAQQYKKAVGYQPEQAGNHYAYDKMSVGNYLNSGYEAFQQHHAEEQHHQQQQQQQQQEQLEHVSYFTPHEGAASATGSGSSASGPSDYEQHQDGEEQSSNFLAESSGHDESHAHSHQSHHHVDIINYVPVKHVKKQHVPVEKTVKIPISHAVIIPIKKPVPIHIPITKQVQVAVEKELKVPVERIVPVPVEKHIPVPVEKRVPYTVVKYLPIKVPKPFPVKVPVFKTILHKVKGWW
ncbi:hornerin [Drosophila virilis]|nr:hornerin [Drosophila virilis]